MTEREGEIIKSGEENQKVIIIDNDENFYGEKGSIPNHDKIEIVYISPKA